MFNEKHVLTIDMKIKRKTRLIVDRDKPRNLYFGLFLDLGTSFMHVG